MIAERKVKPTNETTDDNWELPVKWSRLGEDCH